MFYCKGTVELFCILFVMDRFLSMDLEKARKVLFFRFSGCLLVMHVHMYIYVTCVCVCVCVCVCLCLCLCLYLYMYLYLSLICICACVVWLHLLVFVFQSIFLVLCVAFLILFQWDKWVEKPNLKSFDCHPICWSVWYHCQLSAVCKWMTVMVK